MIPIKVLFENVTESSIWSVPDILTFIAALAAVLVSMYGILQTNKWTKNQIDAEIVSKSRIEWIQKSRELTAVYVSCAFELINYFITGTEILEQKEKDKAVEKLRQKLKESSIQLGLMFGTDGDTSNQLIVRFLDSMTNIITGGTGGTPDYFIELEKEFLVFRDYMSYYFKVEWKRSNLSYTDEIAQEKQSSNPKYKDLENLTKKYEELMEEKNQAIKESVQVSIENSEQEV